MINVRNANILSIFYIKDMERTNDKNVTELELCTNITRIKSLIYHLFLFIGLGECLFTFLLRKIEIGRYDIIIINEMAYAEDLVKYIRKRNPNCYIIYWLWNTLALGRYMKYYNKYRHFNILKKIDKEYNFHIVSFDKNDCKDYNLIPINQVACKYSIPCNESMADIFFVGRDKGRIKEIHELSHIFHKYNLNFQCWILPEKENTYTVAEERLLYKEDIFIPYKKIVLQDCQSKALLDFVQKNQRGLTWRPIEALYYKKKLITNYVDIVNYDFYCKENIFILGIDDFSELYEFVNSPYKEISESIIYRYTYLGALQSVLDKLEYPI